MFDVSAHLDSARFVAVLPLFISTFATLLAIINPLEVLPIFLSLTHDKDQTARRHIARRACLFAFALLLFFLFFGAFVLKLFGVSLAMVRVAGGIVLTRIGFELFAPTGSGHGALLDAGPGDDIAFMPLAMPLMCGPGAIATVLGMMATIEKAPDEPSAFVAIFTAVVLAVFATYLCLASAGRLVGWFGPIGIAAITRIVGFFVSAMGVSLVFDGVVAALQVHGVKVFL